MPPRASKEGSTKKGSSARASSGYSGKVRLTRPSEEPKWQVDADFKPPRKISDKELEAARKMFFELDRDGSGSIDAEELGLMLRGLGQNPSEQELIELIDSVDTGDKDGQVSERGKPSGDVSRAVSHSYLRATCRSCARSHTYSPVRAQAKPGLCHQRWVSWQIA